jgi:hypothetical protein
MTADLAESALKVSDLQAVLPTLATLAIIRFGNEDDAGALDMLRGAIERRGDIDEAIMSPWLAFEATDALELRIARDPTSRPLRDTVELLASFCRRIARDVMAGGDLVQVEVREALFAASVEQLGSLARRIGASVDLPDGIPGGRASALAVLDREHRRFDAARIRLWLAEEGEGAADLAEVIAVFEELGAHPYVGRALRLRG